MFDVGDGLEQRDEGDVVFQRGEEGAGPCTVARAVDAEFATAFRAEPGHELTQFAHALAETFTIADEVGGDGKFAVEVTGRTAVVVEGKVKEGCVPAEGVEFCGEAAVAQVVDRHEGVEDQHGRGGPSAVARLEPGGGAVVVFEAAGVWRRPDEVVRGFFDGFEGRGGVECVGVEGLAGGKVGFEFLACCCVVAVTPLGEVEQGAGGRVGHAGPWAAEECHSSRPLRFCGVCGRQSAGMFSSRTVRW